MGFSRYILAYSCLAVLCVEECSAIYSGDDPAIREVKDSIEVLKKNIANAQETGEKASEFVAGLKKNFEDTSKDIEALKKRVDEESQKINEQLASVDKKIGNIEENAKSQEGNEETQQLKKTVEELKAEMVAFSENRQAEAEEQEKQRTETTEQLKSDMIALLESKQAETKEETKNQLAEATEQLKSDIAADPENTKAKEKVAEIEKSVEDMKQKIEAQNLEAAKNTARLDKLERGGGSQAASIGSSLLSGAISGGMGLLSNILSADSVKEKMSDSKAVQELTKGMNEEEKAEFSEIEAGIREGKSNQEIQEKLDELKEKVATRVDKDNKFQQTTFYGLNTGFKQRTLLAHIFQQARLGNKISAESVLSGKVNSVDAELIDAIYDMAQKNATFQDIDKYLKLVFVGSPRKVVKPKPETPVVNNIPVNEQPGGGSLQDILTGKAEHQGTPENAKAGEQPVGGNLQDILTGKAEYRETPGNAKTSEQPIGESLQDILAGKTEYRGAPGNVKTSEQPVGGRLQDILTGKAEYQETPGNVETSEQPIAGSLQDILTGKAEYQEAPGNAKTGEQPTGGSLQDVLTGKAEYQGASGNAKPKTPGTPTEQEGRKTHQTGQETFTQVEFPQNDVVNQKDMSAPETQKGGYTNYGSVKNSMDRQRRDVTNLPQRENIVRGRDISEISVNSQSRAKQLGELTEPEMPSRQTNNPAPSYDDTEITRDNVNQLEDVRRSGQMPQILSNENKHQPKDRGMLDDVSHQNTPYKFENADMVHGMPVAEDNSSVRQNGADASGRSYSRPVQNQVATPAEPGYQKGHPGQHSQSNTSRISGTDYNDEMIPSPSYKGNYTPRVQDRDYAERVSLPLTSPIDGDRQNSRRAHSESITSATNLAMVSGGKSQSNAGNFRKNKQINDTNFYRNKHGENNIVEAGQKALQVYEKFGNESKQGFVQEQNTPQKSYQPARYDISRESNMLPRNESSYYGKQHIPNYPEEIYADRANVSAEQKSTSRERGTQQKIAQRANSAFLPQSGYQQDAYELDRYTNKFPDVFDMTVMDVDDNSYYDVSKKKFMQISRKSERFPKRMRATSMNVDVSPIDVKSEQRAMNFEK